MSLFSGIAHLEHSTAAWFEKELLAVEGKAPTIERIIDMSLSYLGPTFQIALQDIGDPADAAKAGAIIAKAQADLLVGSALVTDFGPTPTASSVFASVQTNLQGIEGAIDVKSAKTTAAISKAVGEVGALASAISTAAAAIKGAAQDPAPEVGSTAPAPSVAEVPVDAAAVID